MAVAVIVVVLSVLSLAVAGSIRPLPHETGTALLRVQTVRAFYAAESGTMIMLGAMTDGQSPPESGAVVSFPEQSIRFESVPDGSGTIVLSGTSGGATRRVSLEVE